MSLNDSGKGISLGDVVEWSLDPAAPADGEEALSAHDVLVSVLKEAVDHFKTKEFALALPLDKFLVSVDSYPVSEVDDIADLAASKLAAISPFPDESATIGFETLSENETTVTVLNAVLPQSVAETYGDAFEAAGVRITNTDASSLGRLRMIWPRIAGENASDNARRLLLTHTADGWDFFVLDGSVVSFVRGLGSSLEPDDIRRELTLSLLSLGGASPKELVIASHETVDGKYIEVLSAFATVRIEPLTDDDVSAAVEGCAHRLGEGIALDVTPDNWRVLLDEFRFMEKLKVFVGSALAIWGVVMAVLIGTPYVFDFLTSRQKQYTTLNSKTVNAVKSDKKRAETISEYSSRTKGALSSIKKIVELMDEGSLLLTSLTYDSKEGVVVSGEADSSQEVYAFKDNLVNELVQPVSGEPFFAKVELLGGVNGKIGQKQSFSRIVASFEEPEEYDDDWGKPAKSKGGAR